MQSTTAARDDHKLGLAAEILRRGGTIRLQALGISMLPSIWPGDLLTIEGIPGSEMVPGDIILFVHDGRFFVHRLISRPVGQPCDSSWITRGDAMPQSDPPVRTAELLGRVSAILQPDGRRIISSRRLSRFACVLAWMVCHCASFRSVLLRIHSFRQNHSLPALPRKKTGRGVAAIPLLSCLFREE
jgi:Peptidase S24-like